MRDARPTAPDRGAGRGLPFCPVAYSPVSVAVSAPHVAVSLVGPPRGRTDDEKAKDDWIGAVGRAIVRCSSTYVAKGGPGAAGGGGPGVRAGGEHGEEGYDSDDLSNASNNPYFND